MAETPKEPDGEGDVGKADQGGHKENLQVFLKPLILSESREETQKQYLTSTRMWHSRIRV